MLRDRHRDAADVGLLEGVGADGGAGDLAGDRDDRHGVHVGVGERRHEVRRAGAGGRHADADLAGRGGVALGRMAGALLVADEDVADLLRVEHRVVGREDRAPRDAEDRVAADGLEGEYERLRPGDLEGRRGRPRRACRRRRAGGGPGRPRRRAMAPASSCRSRSLPCLEHSIVVRCRADSSHKKTLRSRGGTEGSALTVRAGRRAREVRGVWPRDNRPTKARQSQSNLSGVSTCDLVISPTVAGRRPDGARGKSLVVGVGGSRHWPT